MSNLTVDQALQMAKAHQQAGQLSQAEALCRQLLHVLPRQPDALHLLGVIAHQTNHLTEARDLIAQAIAINAANPAFYLSLGEVYLALGQADEAAAILHRALKIDPGCAAAYFLLGALHQRHGRLDEAIASYQKALALAPNYAAGYINLGVAFLSQGRPSDAAACYQRALAVNPANADAHINLGVVLYSQGQLSEAAACHQRALAINPAYAEAYYNLGVVLMAQQRTEEAAACFQKALDCRPGYMDAWNNLGVAMLLSDRLDEARVCLEQALAFRPDSEVYGNLGSIFQAQGRIEEAIAAVREAVRLMPEEPARLSSLLLALHMHPGYDAHALLQDHQQWEEKHGKTRQRFHRPHANAPEPDKRLKIGYVSPSLWNGPVGCFLRPLFENHDHQNFEVVCYSDAARPDRFTTQLQSYVDGWQKTAGWDEERLAEQIRADSVDVLVDLSLHSLGNRMLVFARKPAPVQVTWLAYPSTSGLQAMDYRITDPYLDPPSSDDACYSETSIRLPQTFWCYAAPEEAPDVTPLPALSNGFVTFGCLNNFAKVNAQVLTLWAKLLRAMPNARMVLYARPGSHREQTQTRLAAEGIHRERVRFVDTTPLPEYFANHAQTDIALDPFPYAGGTTSCDALWMGVPVVTLAGKTAVGRGGVSILSNIGLPELIARSEDEYVQIAVELANDLPRLSDLRATLRDRMQCSPLMDGPRFARGIEAAYRGMWQQWCKGR